MAPSYISPNAGELRGLSQWVQLYSVHRSPNKLWRSHSIRYLTLCPLALTSPLELQPLVPGDAVLLDVGDAQLRLQGADLGRLPPHQLLAGEKARAARLLSPLPADSAHILHSNLKNKKKWLHSFRKLGGRQCFWSVFIWYGSGSSTLGWIPIRIQSGSRVLITKNLKIYVWKKNLDKKLQFTYP